MTGQGKVLLVTLMAAGAACLLYILRRRVRRPPTEGAKNQLGRLTDRHDEPAVPAENSEPGAVLDKEEQREEEQSKAGSEVARTPSAGDSPRPDASESEQELAQSADPTVGWRMHQIALENAGAASGGGLSERHEGKTSEDESSTTELSVGAGDSEEATSSTASSEGLEVSSDTDVGQSEEAALPPPTEDAGDEEGLDGEEQAEEAAPPSLDNSRRQEEKARKKKPRKYEGLDHSAPKAHERKQRGPRPDGEEAPARDRSLPLEVRLRFDRGGFCRLSLIARRSNGLPEDIAVSTQSGQLELRAMQDEWYQDVSVRDLSRVLEQGTVWTQEGTGELHSWSLSGRPVYVLAARSDISGFVSQPRLVLDKYHVVLCKAAIRSKVEHAIQQAGATAASVLDERMGAPQGWIVFRGVVPTRPVTPASDADVFSALRPLPQIEISLEGGIRLEYANWLEGYPPMITVYGDPEHTAEVTIDGKAAERGDDGCFLVPGWDSVGSHTIWCSGASKSYSIVPFDSTCEPWDAYTFPVSYGSKRRIAICGPLTRCVPDEIESRFGSVIVPEANPILLGRTPGQLAFAQSASGVRGTPLIASPPFSPVWALPCDPLHCDKRTARILLIGKMASPEVASSNPRQRGILGNRSIEAWCRFILDSSRKGIRTEPDNQDTRALWLQYKLAARCIWRGRK